jgi:hypothetical protein
VTRVRDMFPTISNCCSPSSVWLVLKIPTTVGIAMSMVLYVYGCAEFAPLQGGILTPHNNNSEQYRSHQQKAHSFPFLMKLVSVLVSLSCKKKRLKHVVPNRRVEFYRGLFSLSRLSKGRIVLDCDDCTSSGLSK